MTQDEALAILESGESVLLTGAAGTGKTYVLNCYINRARKDGKHVAVTATTGLAATHLQGTTVHAWAGIGVHDDMHPRLVQRMSQSRRDLIRKADVLVIDEISMLHDFRLDLIEEVTRMVRESEKPFGGLQVVLCGDFFQLPPVSRHDSRQGGFVTTSRCWQQNGFTVCYLEKQYRQAQDDEYAQILNGIRAGFLSGRQLARLRSRSEVFDDPFEAKTWLLTTNRDVDEINQAHLNRVDGEEHIFEMQHSGAKRYVESLKKSCLAPELLVLKVGARVMCIKNSNEKKYVNGSLGTVVRFDNVSGYPIVELRHGREVEIKPDTWELMDGDKRRASIVQLPLRLAWAITVHKSQGMTLDAARIDLRGAFVEGMGYVALSRVKNLDSLQLDGLNGMALRVSIDAKAIDQDLKKRSDVARTVHQETFKNWHDAEAKRTEKEKAERDRPAAGSPWKEKVEQMRKTYPNAYKPWSEQDATTLRQKFLAGASVEDLSDLFGRHVGAISMRLQKEFGENVVLKHRSDTKPKNRSKRAVH